MDKAHPLVFYVEACGDKNRRSRQARCTPGTDNHAKRTSTMPRSLGTVTDTSDEAD